MASIEITSQRSHLLCPSSAVLAVGLSLASMAYTKVAAYEPNEDQKRSRTEYVLRGV